MSKSNFKGSLLATTVIAGSRSQRLLSRRTPDRSAETAPPAPVDADDTQGNTPPAAPSDQTPARRRPAQREAAPAGPRLRGEIVVTGTLIRNPNLVRPRRSRSSARTKSSFARPTPPKKSCAPFRAPPRASASRSTTATAVPSYVDLRGLGTNRNLVLLDGVRIVPVDQRRPRRLEQHPAGADRPRRRADRRCVDDLRRRRGGGRRQLHHPQRFRGHRAAVPSRSPSAATATTFAPT